MWLVRQERRIMTGWLVAGGWLAIGAAAAPVWVRFAMSDPIYPTWLCWVCGSLIALVGPFAVFVSALEYWLRDDA